VIYETISSIFSTPQSTWDNKKPIDPKPIFSAPYGDSKISIAY